MNNTWHEKIAGSLFADETGKVIGEVVNPFDYPFAGFVAKVEGEIIGSYISVTTARIAVELFVQAQTPGRTIKIEPLVYDDPGENKIVGNNPTMVICDDPDS